MFHTARRVSTIQRTETSIWAALLLLLAAIFVLDLQQPSDVIFSILYVVPIVLTLGLGQSRATYLVFVIASVATVAGAAFGSVPAHPTAALTNRMLALMAQVLAAAVVIQQLELRARQLAATADRDRDLHAARTRARYVQINAAALERVFESLPEAVLVLDAGSRILRANTAALQVLRQTRSDVIGRQWAALLALDEVRSIDGLPLPSENWPLQGPEAIGLELRVFNEEGGVRCCQVSGTLLRDRPDSRDGAVVVIHDVTAQRVLDRNKVEFLSLVAHELRNPLATTSGFTQLAQSALTRADLPETTRLLDRSLHQVDRLNRLVSELLDVARIETGRLEIRRAPMDLAALVLDAVEQARAVDHAHIISLDVIRPIPMIPADAGRLEQVLGNLLDNARKYSPGGGHIQVELRGTEQDLLVSVRDRGIGIAASEQGRLFERFYRAESGVRRASGLGVGLHISRQIVQAHGGRIWVESAPGQGSTFTFTIPRAVDAS